MQLLIHKTESPTIRKVLLVAHELDIKLDLEFVAWPDVEHRQPQYLKFNPSGKFPTLIDGDFTLWESNAIIEYLATKAGRLLPTNPQGRSDVLRWLFWESAQFCQPCLALTYDWFNPARKVAPEMHEKYYLEFRGYTEVLNRQLGHAHYVAGRDLTIADLAIASDLTYYKEGRLPVRDFINVQRWLELIESRPSWKATDPHLMKAEAAKK